MDELIKQSIQESNEKRANIRFIGFNPPFSTYRIFSSYRYSSTGIVRKFELFYGNYPRRINKVQAELAYNKAIMNGATHAELINGAIQYQQWCDRKTQHAN